MTKINKNVNVNSMSLTSNIKKSESSKEEKLKRKSEDKLAIQVRQAITRQNAILRDIKDSQPLKQLGMTDNLSHPSNGLKKIPELPPKPLAMMSSSSSIAPKSKPLPDTPNKNNFLPHNSFKVVARNKPLPPVPPKSVSQSNPQSQPQPQPQFQPQVQTNPQPQPSAIDIPKLGLGVLLRQMALFKNAVGNNSDQINDLIAELNKFSDEDITNTACERFANNGMRVGPDITRLKAHIKKDVKLFASAWMKMINSNSAMKDEPWYDGITEVADSITKKWN